MSPYIHVLFNCTNNCNLLKMTKYMLWIIFVSGFMVHAMVNFLDIMLTCIWKLVKYKSKEPNITWIIHSLCVNLKDPQCHGFETPGSICYFCCEDDLCNQHLSGSCYPSISSPSVTGAYFINIHLGRTLWFILWKILWCYGQLKCLVSVLPNTDTPAKDICEDPGSAGKYMFIFFFKGNTQMDFKTSI